MVYNQWIYPIFYVGGLEMSPESEKQGTFDPFLVSGFSRAAECRITAGVRPWNG